MSALLGRNIDELQKIKLAMTTVDNLSPELRELVHEFDLGKVVKCLNAGMTDHKEIRKLLTGVRKEAQRRILAGEDPTK
jgi:hypothetical protein